MFVKLSISFSSSLSVCFLSVVNMSDSEDPLSSLDSLVEQYELDDLLDGVGDCQSNVQNWVKTGSMM